MSKAPAFTRDRRFRRVVAGVGLVALISVVVILVVRIPGWFDRALQDVVDEALQDVFVEVDEALQEVLEVNSSAAVEEALEEALRRFDQVVQEALSELASTAESARGRGGVEEAAPPPLLSRADAILLVKFNVGMMTRRYTADTIQNTHTLRDVDITTQAKVEYFKGRLAASVRANLGGSLDETRFQNGLQLSPGTTVEAAGDRLGTAYRLAWSAN